MKFKLETLVDITHTGARRGDDSYKYKQQQNYMTLLQTISLRSNPTLILITNQKRNIDNSGFGSKHKGNHQVWTMYFEFEAEESHSIDLLITDVNYVPIITGIDETAKFPTKAFICNNNDYNNIFFKLDDK
tara:strand:- start:262 stop:654 length:393 start_codon:yes stop_codon:yes gene_type:complete